MAGRPQHLTLTPEQNEQLRSIEHSPHIKPKIRLRAHIIRLNAAGWRRHRIAQHTRRTYSTIFQDLQRFLLPPLDANVAVPWEHTPDAFNEGCLRRGARSYESSGLACCTTHDTTSFKSG